MEKRPTKAMLPLILVFAIIFGMLSISFYYLYNAYQASLQDNSEGVLFNALLGSVGIGVSIYMTRIITRRSFSKKVDLARGIFASEEVIRI